MEGGGCNGPPVAKSLDVGPWTPPPLPQAASEQGGAKRGQVQGPPLDEHAHPRVSDTSLAWETMSFQVHHGRRRGSTRAVTAPAFPPDARPSSAVRELQAQPRETVATAHGSSRDQPLLRAAAFGGSSSAGSLNNQLRAMRATGPSRRSHHDILRAPLPPRPRLPPRGTLLEQLAQCQTNTDSLISDLNITFKSRYDRTGLLLVLPARHLHVGRCGSQSGLPPYVFEDATYVLEAAAVRVSGNSSVHSRLPPHVSATQVRQSVRRHRALLRSSGGLRLRAPPPPLTFTL